jgi:hypothetical protein
METLSLAHHVPHNSLDDELPASVCNSCRRRLVPRSHLPLNSYGTSESPEQCVVDSSQTVQEAVESAERTHPTFAEKVEILTTRRACEGDHTARAAHALAHPFVWAVQSLT